MGSSITKQQVLEAFYFRHACKVFDAEKKIPDEEFAFLLETVRLSPSSFGYEPWHVLVLQNMPIRERLLPAVWGAQRQLPTCSHYIVLLARKSADMHFGSDYTEHIIADVQKLTEEAAQRRRAHYQTFQESDFDILEDRAMFDWACRQCYIALGNMMTAAAMIGIDSCPVEGFVLKDLETILTQEGLLDQTRFGVACMAAFGYRIEPQKQKTRRPLGELVTFIK